MWTTKLVGGVLAALLVADQASALDMCFQSGSGLLFVAKSYKRPGPGKCRPLTGYEASTAVPHPATGTVCLNAFGTLLYVHWSALIDDGDGADYGVRTRLPYPSLTEGRSSWISTTSSGTSSGVANGVSAYRCEPAPMP
ncbi:MAG TPA: hypothetical protein VFD92_08765 [Candidatus Binatia bacterium]|nr:hypothetical protein [Candidatus Binatia bacterium]